MSNNGGASFGRIPSSLDQSLDDGLTSLARLAAESGGRFTENANDLTLGVARAQRDLSCVYTVGLYVEEAQEDETRRVKVFTSRPGVQVRHPDRYVFRSRAARRESTLQAAWFAPELFQSPVVRAHVFPMRPASASTWEAMLAVSFPVPLAESGGAAQRREFGAVVTNGPDVIHRFQRVVTLEPEDASVTSAPTVTFLEPITIRPGEYTVTVVNADPSALDPEATRVQVSVPEIRKGKIFLVEPVLGRPSGNNLVVYGGGETSGDRMGESGSFEPLMIRHLDEPADLVALSQACFVPKKKRRKRAPRSPEVERGLSGPQGEELGWLDPLTPELENLDGVHCGTLVDVIPPLADGEYSFEVSLRKGDDAQRVRFAIGKPKVGSEAPSSPAP